MSASTPAPNGVRVSDLLQTAARLFRATLLKCLPMGMIAVLCASLPNIYWNATGHTVSLFGPYDTNFRVLSVIGVAIALWVFGAMMLRQRAVVLGAPILLGAELQASLRRLPVVLLSTALANLSVSLGLLLLLVPGLYLLVCYLVLLPVVLFEGAGPVAALLRSVQIMRRLWWPAVAALVIAVLLSFIGALVFAAVLAVAAEIFASNGAAMQAFVHAGVVGFYGLFSVYLSALQLVLHSAASSSA
ncbi:MAG TPA: hypothetical protein VGP20_09550 [Steroidobacteraceae bacterium]|nr:hypothetical protein [Steroidobacteraceae bacterium]